MKAALMVCCLALCLAGCGPSGPKLYPVVGQVKVDGKPAEHALVFMHRKERNAMIDPLPYGTCTADGSLRSKHPALAKVHKRANTPSLFIGRICPSQKTEMANVPTHSMGLMSK